MSHSSPPARPVSAPPDASPDRDRALGLPGFTFGDLFEPLRLADLHAEFESWFARTAPEDHARFEAYRACKGEGMTAEGISEALLAAAPHVSSFVGRLFGVERALNVLRGEVHDRDPLWRFKRDFAKKRVLRADAGKGWRDGPGGDAVSRRTVPEGGEDDRRTVGEDAERVATLAMGAALDDAIRY